MRPVATGALCAAAALMLASAFAAPAPDATDGKRIYRDGLLASGAALRGERFGAPALVGQGAACVQCHRRSGMGMVEGQIVIPPISGRFLFKPGKRIAPDSRQHEDATHLPPTPSRIARASAPMAVPWIS